MALVSAQVVDALAARLVGNTAAGARVYTDRLHLHPFAESELPAWRVIAEDEPVQIDSTDSVHRHDLLVSATAYTRAVSGLDDALHALAEAGLPFLFADPLPYGLTLEGIARDLVGEGEAAMGAISLKLRTVFFARPNAPGTFV